MKVFCVLFMGQEIFDYNEQLILSSVIKLSCSHCNTSRIVAKKKTFLFAAIKQSDVEDVRDVLEYYRQFDDPIETFRENQRKLQVI
jgi:hypothetical protein